MLENVVIQREYLNKLAVLLFPFLSEDQRPEGLSDVLGSERWPERVSTQPFKEWISELRPLLAAQARDIEIDRARLELEPPPPSERAYADWTDLTVDHPAYRRAVPHLHSFLREADFDSHLLELTHEITHVLSIMGGVGTALTSLRVATLDPELTLWSLVPGASEGDLNGRIAKEGVALLEEGKAASLFRVEQGLELTLKAHILQDVWTPWFEGLAIFSEMAADPALDPTGIGPVTRCLRNLVDFYPPTNDSGGSQDIERIKAAYEEYVTEFETRCSAAIARRGPGRLRTYFRTTEVPYFSGYLAIRSIVSAWRVTTERPLTGTEAFGLLLHATRYGTFNAVPDLSFRSDIFARAALEMMCDWTSRLAQLSREEIEDFLTPPLRDGPGRIYRWEGARLIRVTIDDVKMRTEQSGMVKERLRQALSSLSRPEDITRLARINAPTRILLEAAAQTLNENVDKAVERYSDLVEWVITRDSLLPIGHTSAKFFVNINTDRPTSYLATQMRTSEARMSDGSPSINGSWFSIDHASGQQIATSFRRLGEPRLQVTRVIDLTDIAVPDGRLLSLHLLVYRYGDWFDIRGVTPSIDALLNQDADYRDSIRNLVRARLYPEPFIHAATNVIARGERGAARARDWVAGSKAWSIGDIPVEVEDWAGHVQALAERILAHDERRTTQVQAARALTLALFADNAFVDNLLGKDFETLTENAPDQREHLISVLFTTAQKPKADAAIGEAVTTFASAGLKIFSAGVHGWDVCAAVRPRG